MTPFHGFLRDRIEAGGFSTEDALASFLPLVREVIETHAQGLVAPLEGLAELYVDGNRIWFEEAKRLNLRRELAKLQQVKTGNQGAVDIVAESRRTTQIEGGATTVNLAIGDREDATVTRPVYLAGYVSWEHQIGHHDPLTDIFSLGMILASLSLGLDFHEPGDLEEFVSSRGNLFTIAPNLHPVLARAIVRMTEIDRHRRTQELAALLHSLVNYRDQEVDFDLDLARVQGFREKDSLSKQSVVLTKLKERLFEVSRRNRLLHFRPTMHTVNLTHASVPLSFDITRIRPDQILVWTDNLHKLIAEGKRISLNKHLNFAEALYLPSVLNHVIADARRDQAEFGLAQLRLVACFLYWANLKEKPIEQFASPLVLVPVQLKKKKGIRDIYFLEPLSSEAEINPVIRHQFKHLYDIDLPESVDLTKASLDQFYEFLSAKIQASDPAIALDKIDRPRIALIHDKARRRLDQYRRRARLAGRGVRHFLDLDYSYDPANYHPLGIKLFSARIRPPGTQLRAIIEEKPRPRSFVMPEPDPPVVEKERTFFHLRDGGAENPYTWGFDFCNLTLANFRYRRMSLVRDYDTLLDEQPPNPAFDATFALVPRPLDHEASEPPALADRFDVVPSDPTQATAVSESHASKSYIIQGPPGTGKSQTITNLIADAVAHGKRVLFVCEKRAAIDVVFARLRQCGLADLCCLIHDSQVDKKQFVMDLKDTYETFLTESDEADQDEKRRKDVLRKMRRDLKPLQDFDAAMRCTYEYAGLSVRDLLERCILLRDQLPRLSAIERERLPDYASWWRCRDRIEQFGDRVRDIQPDGILANHPLRQLSPRLAAEDHPLEVLTSCITIAESNLSRLEAAIHLSGIDPSRWNRLSEASQLIEYGKRLRSILRQGPIQLLDPDDDRAQRFVQSIQEHRDHQESVDKACHANRGWKQKIAAEEVSAALAQARMLEANFFGWLKPAWWRLRGVLHRCYDFKSHVVRPSWAQVLEALEFEYTLRDELDSLEKEIARDFGIDGDIKEFVSRVLGLRELLATLPEWLLAIHQALLASDTAQEAVEGLVEADEYLEGLTSELDRVFDDYHHLTLVELGEQLGAVRQSLDDLPDFLQCLSDIAPVPDSVSDALRSLPCSPLQVEAAVADVTLERIYRDDRGLHRFDGNARTRRARSLEQSYRSWLTSNAATIRSRVKQRFRHHVHLSGLPAAQLEAEQKDFKRRYNKGRRELEHEFGKSMRYKSIRDLVAGESGDVVRDLKPVWLMSPLSVSDTLPLDCDHVDVVIFDEASQITLEESIPSIFRAGQAIVVGDEMQLPPTDFFSARRSEEEEELLVEEAGELIHYDLDSNSFLNHAANNLPSTMLGWHYRSRSESLISFSNWVFYGGRLLTVPEEQLPVQGRNALDVLPDSHGEAFADEALGRSISFHFLEHGVYDKRRNRAEAAYIAQLVRCVLHRQSKVTIGIIAFSEAQQDEINLALERLAQDDREFRELLEQEIEREEGGQFVGLLVKNLENIQGDERDIIILSVCYGYGPNAKMRMNFGPINKSGGEKRLNVAFSRAKHNMAVVSSIRHSDITNDYNDGANCLKNYLRYAEAVSSGDLPAAERVLHGMSQWHGTDDDENVGSDSVATQIATALEERGYLVDFAVGQSHFRCDLAVRRAGDEKYRLGILTDSDAYYAQNDLLERDYMRPTLLRNFGWNVEHVLAKDWYDDSAAVMRRLLRRIEGQDEDEPAKEEAILEDLAAEQHKAGDCGASGAGPVGNGTADMNEPRASGTELVDAAPAGATAEALVPGACDATDLAPPGAAEKSLHYFELVSDRSRKFWEISQNGCEHLVRFGRLGTAGQVRTKTFDSPEAAQRDLERLIREKIRKGYQAK